MSRKCICLFHRMDLTNLFGDLAAPLSDVFDVVHLAYGDEEVAKLRAMGVQGEIVHFKDEIAKLVGAARPGAGLLDEIDQMFIAQSGGAFSLNSAIQSDRGFALLDYAEALHMTAVYHRFWTAFLDKYRVDYVLHEPCTLMFNFVAAMVLSQRGGHYVYAIMAQGRAGTFNHLFMTGFDFTCPDLDRRRQEQMAADQGALETSAAQAFLDEFRQSYDTFLGGIVGSKVSLPRMAAKSVLDAWSNFKNRRRHDRLAANIDYWRFSQNRGWMKLVNLWGYWRHLRYDAFDPECRYFFYPLHLEPEAVILYHGHGIYENQVKLIQNIAAQLPPDTYLYVKDHPHDTGYRALADYLAIQKVPNVRLLDNSLSGKQIIHGAEGVITVTGTAGFEALLLGKQVYTFGKTFYSDSPNVTYIRHIRDLRDALYARRGQDLSDDTEILAFLEAYSKALQPGLTDYFAGRASRYGIDLAQNSEQVARNLSAMLKAL